MPTEQRVRQSIRRAAKNGRVTCKQLLDLAERTGTVPKEIGRICDEMDIRICACQLGCFR